jgi:hypothetical protein
VLQGNSGSPESRLSAEDLRVGNNAAQPLAIQVYILKELLPQWTVVNRYRQFASLGQKIAAAHLPASRRTGGFTQKLPKTILIFFGQGEGKRRQEFYEKQLVPVKLIAD